MEISELAAKIVGNWPAGTVVGTTAELTRLGLGPRLLAAGVGARLLYRIRHGAYIKMADWQDKLPSERDYLRIAAHSRACGGRSVYSHVSAARIWGLYVWNSGPLVHITAPSSLSSTSSLPGVRVHRRVLLDAQSVRINHRRLGSVRLTSLEQTIVDCARTTSFVTAVIMGDSGLHKGASLALMRDMLDDLAGHRGVRAARKVLNTINVGSESAGESRLRLVVADMDIPQPELQVRVQAAGNSYRLDAAWRDIKLALEFDGKTKYFDYKRTDQAIFEERQRERELMEAGWTFLRVEWKDLEKPELLERRILAALATARRRSGR